MNNQQAKEKVLDHIAGNRQWYKATGRGRSKWHVGNDVVHVRYRSKPKRDGVTYAYNINPNTLASDFELWICGDPGFYYLIPIKVMKGNYSDPDAYVDTYHPEIRVVDINTQTHQALYASPRKQMDFSPYFRAAPRKYSSNLEVAVESDLDSLRLEEEYFDGKKTRRYSSYFERNPKLRAKAISFHGTRCIACVFSFQDFYRERGKDFIEVHHLQPVSELRGETNIDLQTDMAVLCSNCHRMIHQKKDQILSIAELKEVIRRQVSK